MAKRALARLHRNPSSYQTALQHESKKWGEHFVVKASGEMNAWLDHPTILAHYQALMQIDGLKWEEWIPRELNGPAERSLDLGCGTAWHSLYIWEMGASRYIEGLDISDQLVAEAERNREKAGARGHFWVEDVNQVQLRPNSYDLIFSCHSFHHFLELEHIYEQVIQALTPRGLFVLEEFVGPSQFQWSDEQLAITRGLLALIPGPLRVFQWSDEQLVITRGPLALIAEPLRTFRRGRLKVKERRPAPRHVERASPFEAIRSQEIVPLFKKYFDVVVKRPLGGTIQHLLYNGIIRNFDVSDEQTKQVMEGIWGVEDALIASGLLPSDFMLLVGRRR